MFVNGISQSSPLEGLESQQPPGIGAELYLAYYYGAVNDIPHRLFIYELGNQIYTYVDGKPTFVPGTFIFPEVTTVYSAGDGSTQTYNSAGDKLVITQTDALAPTPEPSTFALFGTGVLGVFAVARKRFAS